MFCSKEELVYREVNYGSIKGIKSLRRNGAGLEWTDKEGNTPLMLACMRPDLLNVAKVLIELGANVNAAGGSISKKMGPIIVEKGVVVVDNSLTFRMDPNVPLVISEVNAEATGHIKLKGRSGKGALIANPNCSTIICLMAATPLHQHAKVVRMDSSDSSVKTIISFFRSRSLFV